MARDKLRWNSREMMTQIKLSAGLAKAPPTTVPNNATTAAIVNAFTNSSLAFPGRVAYFLAGAEMRIFWQGQRSVLSGGGQSCVFPDYIIIFNICIYPKMVTLANIVQFCLTIPRPPLFTPMPIRSWFGYTKESCILLGWIFRLCRFFLLNPVVFFI